MKIRKLYKSFIAIILLTCALAIFYYNNSTIIFSSNLQKSINTFWRKEVSIKEVQDFEAYGKKFKLILSTPINNEKYKYLNCYIEKMNGLYYKSYQASEQGGSNASFNFSTIIINDLNKENYLTIVYGYNESLEIVNYEIKVGENKNNFASNIANKKYFIDAVKGKFQDIVKVTDKYANNKTNVFND